MDLRHELGKEFLCRTTLVQQDITDNWFLKLLNESLSETLKKNQEDQKRTVLLALADVDCIIPKHYWAWEGLFTVLVQEVNTEHVQSCTVVETCYFQLNMVPILNTYL